MDTANPDSPPGIGVGVQCNSTYTEACAGIIDEGDTVLPPLPPAVLVYQDD